MYTHSTTPSGAPVHAYALGDGHTLTLTPYEQKALERLRNQLTGMARRLLDAGLAADPKAAAPTPHAINVIESIVTDVALWFLSMDAKKLARDPEMQQQPPLLPDLLRRLAALPAIDAKVVQHAVCTSKHLWRELCFLSQSADFNPDSTQHPQVYNDMRLRYYPWINKINRALEERLTPDPRSASPAFKPAQSDEPLPPPKPPRATPQKPPRATPQQAALVAKAAQEISTPHEWRGLGGEIAPHVVVTLPGWPSGCPLHICNMQGGLLDTFGPPPAPGKRPVTLLLNAGEGHYSAQTATGRVPVPPGGDCFYRAILVGMSSADRTAFLESVGADPKAPYTAESLSKLREATSQQLAAAPARFGSILELLQIAEG